MSNEDQDYEEANVQRIVAPLDATVREHLRIAADIKPMVYADVDEAVRRLRLIAKKEPGEAYWRMLDQVMVMHGLLSSPVEEFWIGIGNWEAADPDDEDAEAQPELDQALARMTKGERALCQDYLNKLRAKDEE